MSWTISGSENRDVAGIENVSLLLHGNGTNGSTTITDSSPTPKTVTAVGNAQISTAQSKFGGASIAFDGTGDWLTLTLSPALGTQDFTVEAWAYISSLSTNRPVVQIGDTYSLTGLLFYITTAGRIALAGNNKIHILGTTQTISTATWVHLAVTRSSNTVRTFVNGVQDGSATLSTNYSNTTVFIGRELFNNATGVQLNGYLNEVRITQNIARYTANFTPPTAPFPDI